MKRIEFFFFLLSAMIFLGPSVIAIIHGCGIGGLFHLATPITIHISKLCFDYSVFYRILITNILVILEISFLGYFTAGFVSAVLLVWNGSQLVMIMDNVFLSVGESIQYVLFHGIYEFLAMCFSGVIGFGGFIAYKNFFSGKAMPRLNLEFLLVSLILVLIGAIIETLLITSS